MMRGLVCTRCRGAGGRDKRGSKPRLRTLACVYTGNSFLARAAMALSISRRCAVGIELVKAEERALYLARRGMDYNKCLSIP